jgi:small neutral amino acid transporter SnatA (MarC family)
LISYLTFIRLLLSDAILRIIGRQGAAILVRVMGIILALLAVEIVLTTLGVTSWATVSPYSAFASQLPAPRSLLLASDF